MKVIIAGSRSIDAIRDPLTRSHSSHNYAMLQLRIERAVQTSTFDITQVISGNAKGVDMAAIKWARGRKLACMLMPANWNSYGLAAGPMRNSAMAIEADALVALWDGQSTGTYDMIKKMKALDKPCHVVTIPKVKK